MSRKIDVFVCKAAVLGLLLSLPAAARDEYTRTFDKTLSVTGGARVRVEHKFGDIVIRTHAGPEVNVHAEIRVSASGEQQARQFADRVEIQIEKSSELSIRTRYPENPNSLFGRNVSYSIHYDIALPESSPIEIRNSFGAVSVTGAKAGSDIVNSHGNLVFRDGRGIQRLQNSFAPIEATNNQGDVTIETNNGDVRAGQVTGRLSIRDRFGNVTVERTSAGVAIANTNGAIQVDDSGGPGEIRNAFGNVTVRNFRGDLIVNTTNATVQAEHVAGSSELNTTFGAVRFSDIGGQRVSVRANNSRVEGTRVRGALSVINSFGPVTVSDVQQNVRIESGNGGVTLDKVGGTAAIKTSFGGVHATNIGGDLTIENSNGSVNAESIRTARVTNSFGAVVLNGVNGAVDVQNQNGAVDVFSTSRGGCQPIRIRTSFSTLRVHLPPDASYRVVAKTSFGKIRTDFPISVEGSISEGSLAGNIGGGGCEMQLSDNNGAVEILRGGA